MGNLCANNIERYHQQSVSNSKICLNKFEICTCIGRGSFGHVFKVKLKSSKAYFAMKEMQKQIIFSKNGLNIIKNERKILKMIHSPFTVNLHYAFESSKSLYFILDLKYGGDLRYHLLKRVKFSEETVKFLIGCIFCAMNDLHCVNIVHRDIKPENLLFDSNGYLFLTDFGISKTLEKNSVFDTTGTLGYMAPEVVCGKDHSKSADYFAVGVILFELICGKRPYSGKNRRGLKEAILAKQVKLEKKNLKEKWSQEAIDLANRLILRKPEKRIGFFNSDEFKYHPWFKDFLWNDLYQQKMIAPFIPKNHENYNANSVTRPFDEKKIQIEKFDYWKKQGFEKFYYEKNSNYEFLI